MKRLFLLLLLFCFVIVLNCCVREEEPEVSLAGAENGASAIDSTLTVGIVADAEVVNIRQVASLEGRILDTARRGEMFEVLESGILDTEGNSWMKIRYRGESAFISTAYLYPFEWKESMEISIGQVLSKDVYIYDAVNPEAVVLYRAYKGEPLLLYEAVDGDWYRIFYPHSDAFVRTDQICIENTTVKELLL